MNTIYAKHVIKSYGGSTKTHFIYYSYCDQSFTSLEGTGTILYPITLASLALLQEYTIYIIVSCEACNNDPMVVLTRLGTSIV